MSNPNALAVGHGTVMSVAAHADECLREFGISPGVGHRGLIAALVAGLRNNETRPLLLAIVAAYSNASFPKTGSLMTVRDGSWLDGDYPMSATVRSLIAERLSE